uniref:solute carrier family 35 member G1-like isoform X1 n=2 Tax=Styela clava TaxID=7725 RepID=UPI001939ECFB|nr:solute carrier family 35 member G1-like isoform X1 [Styela clava]
MTDSNQNKKRTWIERIPGIGIICALLSGLFLSFIAIFTKILSSDLHPTQISLSRCYVQFLTLLPLLQYKSNEVDITGPKHLKHLLWARGFVGSGGMILLFISIGKLSAGNAVTISYLRLIMVPFLARLLLKESLTIFDGFFAILSMIGVVLIAKPSFLFYDENEQEDENIIGVLYGISAASLTSLSVIIIRKLGRQTYPMLHVLYYAFCGSITTTIVLMALGEFQYPCWKDLPMLFSVGLLGNLGQYFVTVALHYERAGTVVVLRSAQIIMVYILQVTILEDIPSYLSLIGAAFVLSTSIGIGLRKVINSRKKKMVS